MAKKKLSVDDRLQMAAHVKMKDTKHSTAASLWNSDGNPSSATYRWYEFSWVFQLNDKPGKVGVSRSSLDKRWPKMMKTLSASYKDAKSAIAALTKAAKADGWEGGIYGMPKPSDVDREGKTYLHLNNGDYQYYIAIYYLTSSTTPKT